MVTVLVTGATGGIGRTLVPLLASQGTRVIATGRKRDVGLRLQGANVAFRPADLVEDDLTPLLEGVDTVVHLAARSSPWGGRQAFERDNVIATRRVLEAAVGTGARRFVHASTPAIFAERRDRLDLRSDSMPAQAQVNAYAATKLRAERLVAERTGIATLVVRPSAVLGPDDAAILPRLLRVIRRGVLPLGNQGRAWFHPTDVRDAGAAFASAALGRATGAVNVAGPIPIRIDAMAQALASRLALRLRIIRAPEALMHFAACCAELAGKVRGHEPPLTRYSAITLSWSRTFDLADTASRLGWRPRRGPDEMLAHALSS